MSTPYHFGITPTFAFDDVSGVLAGESVTLCDAAYDFTQSALTVSVNKFNSYITDVTNDGSTSALAAAAGTPFVSTDIECLAMTSALVEMAKGSAKATIAKAITGNPLGDIGELENDTTFDELVSGEILATTVAAAITPDAIVSVAEDIIRNKGLSGDDDGIGGVDPANPFTSGTELVFNMYIQNGSITLNVDAAADLTDTANGAGGNSVAFFEDPLQKFGVGVPVSTDATGGYTVNANVTDNVYAFTENRYASVTDGSTGLVANETYRTTEFKDGGVLVKCKLTLVA